jgi:hypothetical protein
MSKPKGNEKRAWHVTNIYDDDHEYDEIIYATSRNKAIYQSEGLMHSQEWREMRASRAPEFDKFAPDEVPGPTDVEYIERGWGVWCQGCNDGPFRDYNLADEDAFADERGRVWCDECWPERQTKAQPATVAGA